MVGKSRGRGSDGAGPSTGEGSQDGERANVQRIVLSPDGDDDGVWFDHRDVVALIATVIRENYKEHCPNWRSTPAAVRELWWRAFRSRVNYSPAYEQTVRATWEKQMKTRLRQMIYRASQSDDPPMWMNRELHGLVRNRVMDDDFMKRSEVASSNRKSGASEKGKALATLEKKLT
ncbi:hypothetical protein vseg_018275 [Gypsophila vaccaria]